MNYKILLMISFISLFANASNKITITFLLVSKCKTTKASYEISKPIKLDANTLPRWKKDFSEKELYVYQGGEKEELSWQAHTDLMQNFLHKTTMPSGFQMANDRSHHSVTCTAKGGEQEITFYHNFTFTSAICNAAGGAEFMKKMYPLAKWTELPKVPHYYLTNYIDEFSLLNTVKELPEGCRLRNRGLETD